MDLRDPETGETWTVESGRRHFWRKPGSDTIVGTDTYRAARALASRSKRASLSEYCAS